MERYLHGQRVRFTSADRALLAALLHRLPRQVLRHIRLQIRPETPPALAPRPGRGTSRAHIASKPDQPATHGAVHPHAGAAPDPKKQLMGVAAHPRRTVVLGIKVAASTVWQILTDAGIDPAPERTSNNCTTFLPSQAQAILAADFFQTVTLTGTRRYALAVIEHAIAAAGSFFARCAREDQVTGNHDACRC
jgi:putative transposase